MDFSVFSSNFKTLLNSSGLSLKDFSLKTGITTATISRYLSGARTPEVSILVRIASYFNVSVDWILGIENDRYEKLSADEKKVLNGYMSASDDDKNVIHAVLRKYYKE